MVDEDILNKITGSLLRARRDVDALNDALEAPREDVRSLDTAIKELNRVSAQVYDIGVAQITLTRIRQQLTTSLDGSGRFTLNPTFKKAVAEINQWIDTYKSASYNLTERVRALREIVHVKSK